MGKCRRADRRKRAGTVLIVVGMALLLGAAGLFGWNTFSNYRAARRANDVLNKMTAILANSVENTMRYNDGDLRWDRTEMTEIEIDGYMYIGYISIPAIDRNLPVLSEWDYTRLRISPCRYNGTTFENNLVICAHNYPSHFGLIKNLVTGDSVYFTDMDGVVWEYRVLDVMTYQPTDVEKMISGEYDLMLFTCTYGGAARVTVGCELVDRYY